MGIALFQKTIVLAIVLSGSASYAQTRSFPMSVNTATSGESVSSAPASGMVTRSGNSKVIVKIHNSCFGTNLRGVTNPIAPSSIVTAAFTLVIGTTKYPISVNYPAMLVTATGVVGGPIKPIDPSQYSMAAGSTAGVYGNSVILNTAFPTNVKVDSSGNIIDSDPGPVYIVPESVGFTQTVTDCSGSAFGAYGVSSYIPAKACSSYMGQNGPLSASLAGISVSSDKSNVDISVAFPGQTGFCGGYYSPLMVFFDGARPTFANTSDFPLNAVTNTSWPEANHPGYFLAIDRDGSGKITKKDQLFGDNGTEKNGFDVLKKLDTNHDGVIDKRDKDFDKLVLWQDKNGDGISQPEELEKLSKRVVKISLKYKNDRVRPLGLYAEERQRSNFWYKDSKGKVKKGDIVDVWLAPGKPTPPAKITQK